MEKTDISVRRWRIFDRAFKRTLFLSSPTLILLINALFGTEYPPDTAVEYLSPENITDSLDQWISDMVLLINHTDKYHIEVQIADDGDMGLRVFNYDYLEAVKHKTVQPGMVSLSFARSVVVYLEPTAQTPTESAVRLSFADGSAHIFRVPSFRFLHYSIPELEARNLSMLLPFYLLKLRKRISGAKTARKRQSLSADLKGLVEDILQALERSETAGTLTKSDLRTVMGVMTLLYNDLYKSYPEFQEVHSMMDARLYTIVDEAELAGLARGEAHGKAEKQREIVDLMSRAESVEDFIALREQLRAALTPDFS